MSEVNQNKNELVISRVFDAPRVAGAYLYCMRSPEGEHYWGTGIYREINEPEQFVYTDSFADDKGNVVPATHYGMSPDFLLEMLVTVTLEEHDGQTKLTLVHSGIPAGEDRDGAEQGWSESFDKLADYLREESSAQAA
jgi:uncharacterized protein YndB with AHSA1/START domain